MKRGRSPSGLDQRRDTSRYDEDHRRDRTESFHGRRNRSRSPGASRRDKSEKNVRGNSERRARDFSHLLSNEPHDLKSWGNEDEGSAEPVEKEKANFGLSGALNKDTQHGNTYNGVTLKWSEPPDARKPTRHWRLYVFKADKHIDTLHLHRQSAFLIGRERKVADVVLEHQSISKQHAVIQFRLKSVPSGPGSLSPPRRSVQPYLMDLESTNGTSLNGERVDGARYIELFEKDVVKFAHSSRDYVVMCG